jgi:hypothetical protein
MEEDMQAEVKEPQNEEEKPQHEVQPKITKPIAEGNETTQNQGLEGKPDEV